MHPATCTLPEDVHRNRHQANPHIDTSDRAERLENACVEILAKCQPFLFRQEFLPWFKIQGVTKYVTPKANMFFITLEPTTVWVRSGIEDNVNRQTDLMDANASGA